MVSRMTRRRLPLVSILAVTFALALGPRSARADLPGEVRQVLAEKYLARAQVGVAIARLGGGADSVEWLFQHNSTTPLIPASNLKVVTTAAALDRLGPDFKFRTLVLKTGDDLYLVGDGDPTLGDVEMLRKVGWGVDTVFRLWAEELKKRNVTSVNNVYVDDSVFDEQFFHPNWPENQAQKRYVAQVGGVNLNANCIDFFLRVGAYGQPVEYTTVPATRYAPIEGTCVFGKDNAVWLSRHLGTNNLVLRGETNASNQVPISVTIHDPPLFTATVLSETLAASGVTVNGVVGRDRTARQTAAREGEAGGWSVVAALETQLSSVLARANKDSMNLYAEALAKRLGYAFRNGAESGSWANGAAAIGEFLGRCGVAPGQFVIDDGCGLSKQNGLSAESLVRVLAHHHGGPSAEFFRNSLAVAGTDGTFEHRFRGRHSDLRGRVFGKSGYVNNVSSLSGYLQARDGAWYAFSILMNDLPGGTNGTAKELQERIVAAIDQGTEQVAAGE